MKKTGKFLLALGLFLATGVTAFANTQDIRGTDNNFDGTGTIPVNGTIGEFDSTNPDQPNPPITEWWIDLEIPTATVFYSDLNNTRYDLVSPDYDIINHSGRGVHVTVNGFNHVVGSGVFNAINELDVVVGANDVRLITAGTLETFPTPVPLVTIGRQAGTAAAPQPTVETFEFEGRILPGDFPPVTITPSFNLILGFAVNLADAPAAHVPAP